MAKKHPRPKKDRVAEQIESPHKAPVSEDHSPRVPQREKLLGEVKIRERDDLTARQREIIDLILDKKTKVVFINGPAGTSKTWMAVYCGLHLLNQHKVSHISYLRTVIESASRSLGALPGESGDKLAPYLMPLTDKLDEMLSSTDVKRLLNEKRAVGIPVGFLRGASMNAQCIIVDESQNLSHKEMVTVLTRLGPYSKLILCGDPSQSDINGQSGFAPLFELFNEPSSQEEGIHCVTLTKADIVRSGILRHIVDRLEWYQTNRVKH